MIQKNIAAILSSRADAIVNLRKRARPSAIAGFVMTVVVNAIDRVSRRAAAHIVQECGEASSPLFANPNPTGTVVLERSDPRILATRDHRAPSAIFAARWTHAAGARFSMGLQALTRAIHLEAPAATHQAGAQIARRHERARAAIAATRPNGARFVARLSWHARDDGQSRKSHSNQISGTHMFKFTAKSAIVSICLLACSSVVFGQQFTLSPAPYQTVLSSGTIVPSACIWTFAAGTTTAIATYADTAGTLNGNPIIADNFGRFTAYLLPGTNYKFQFENVPCSSPSTHGALIKTQDNIQGVPASAANVDIVGTAGEALTAGQAVYLSDGSGSKTQGQWYKGDSANGYSSTLPVVGIPIANIALGTSGTLRISGYVTGLSSLTVGAPYYVGTAGALTASAPANRRLVGHADTTTTLVTVADPSLMTGLASGTASTGTLLRGDQTWAAVPIQNCGRLTLTTAVPVTTADVTAATTLYYTPIPGCNQATVFASSALKTDTLTETSVAVPATTSQMYDVFAFDNAGAINIELLAWTNDTTRATAITVQNGFLAKSGDATRRYVGNMRTTTVSGQTEDSVSKRYVWNYYNRVKRPLRNTAETADNWNYTTDTFRQANANTANQLDLVIGVAEVELAAEVIAFASNPNAGGPIAVTVGIGEDSTSTVATGCLLAPVSSVFFTSSGFIQPRAALKKYPAVGRHTYVWLERSVATSTTTWYGDNGTTYMQSGILGEIEG